VNELDDGCTHQSDTGIDQSDALGKVWRCDGCGDLAAWVSDSSGFSRRISLVGVIAADDREAMLAALGAEQVGCVTEYLDGKHHCHYDQFSDGKRECRDTHGRIDAIAVYRIDP
jgi:hypothetical protein